jgi:hypothetical protein
MENVGVFYGRLVYFVVIWSILWSFGIFDQFWYVVPRKIWQPRQCYSTYSVLNEYNKNKAQSCYVTFKVQCSRCQIFFRASKNLRNTDVIN